MFDEGLNLFIYKHFFMSEEHKTKFYEFFFDMRKGTN